MAEPNLDLPARLLRARLAGTSRRRLAELTEGRLNEARVEYLEKRRGAARAAEVEVLEAVLTNLEGPPAPVVGPPVAPAAPEPGPAPAVPGEAPAAAVAAPPTPAVPAAAPTRGVPDWTALRGQAAQVGAHEVERALGPDAREARLFSNSELSTARRCERKWWLGWYRGLVPKFESPVGNLAIGDRGHRALARYYVPPDQEPLSPIDALELEVVADWTRLSQALSGDEERLASLRTQFTEEANLERLMVEGYVQWLAETGADRDLVVTDTERYLEAPLPREPWHDGRAVKLIGKIDVRVYRRTDGARLVLDHKWVANFADQRQTAPTATQPKHYHLLEQLVAAEDDRCDGTIYNLLRRVKRTAAAKPPFYDRIEIKHNRHALASYQRSVLTQVADLERKERALAAGAHHLDVVAPQPSRDCAWDCPFNQVCPMLDDGSRAEDMLSAYFRVADPLAYYDPQTLPKSTEGESQ